MTRENLKRATEVQNKITHTEGQINDVSKDSADTVIGGYYLRKTDPEICQAMLDAAKAILQCRLAALQAELEAL